jgi:hypothetical protein
MNLPLKSLVKKINFTLLAIGFVAGTGFGFIPASAQAAPAPATATVTVTAVGGGSVSPNYNGQQLVIGQTYKLQAKAKSGLAFLGWTGSQTTSAEKISFVMQSNLTFTAAFADVKKPTLTIKTPANKSTFTVSAVTVTGVTKDNSTVAQVFYQLNGTGWVAASTGNGWSNWWANITNNPDVNTFEAYAVDAAGNNSKIASLTLNYRVTPDSLSGQSMVVSAGSATGFTMSFTNGTFSQSAADTNFVDGVGTYAYKRINSVTAKLMVSYTAPPDAVSGATTTYLQFTNSNSGVLTNGDGSTSGFVFSTAANTAPASLSGADFVLNSTNTDTQRALFFIAEPFILGNLSAVANPMAFSISLPYAGNIGDRVSVPFVQFKSTKVITNNYVGTIIAATDGGAATNMVAVLFDSSSFASQKEMPAANSLLSVLTYYYTNFISGSVAAAGLGTFTYNPYSPVGGLLSLMQTNESSFYVLTFDSTGSSGTYYQQINPAGGGSGSDAGTFGLIATPQITANPQSLTITNGTDANFNVTASGSSPLIYQWLRNGFNLIDIGNISGSATPSLTLSSVSTNDAASYQVVVTNSFGSVTSPPAVLNVITN